MSLIDFPPMDGPGAVTIQELGGRLVNGNYRDVLRLHQSQLLAGYPVIEKTQLMGLQHSLSREDIRSVFIHGRTGAVRVWDVWKNEGFSGVLRYAATMTDGTAYWAVASLCRYALKFEHTVASISKSVIPSLGATNQDLLSEFSKLLNWKSNWIRSLAFHPDGRRLAVCQRNDYIRVYTLCGQAKSPVTLRHPLQCNVADIAWKPFDQMVLAVAAESAVLIWRLDPHSLTNRPAPQCAQVLSMPGGFSPLIQVIWDNAGCSLYTVSPASNRILIWNPASGCSDSVSAWSGSTITRLSLSPKCDKLFVQYNANLIRVYDTQSWADEKWTGLSGRCRSAVWSPDGSHLLFTTTASTELFSISFGAVPAVAVRGETRPSSLGGSIRAISVFDFAAVETHGCEDDDVIRVGGLVHDMVLSDDGQRLAVSFQKHPETVALFVVGWKPSVLLAPCGLIRGPDSGYAELLRFQPNYEQGALLTIVWSSGKVHFTPLLYAKTPGDVFDHRRLLHAHANGSTTSPQLFSH